ncbi:MAG: HAMP domain-containing sensor histidine kinase [Bacteroidetes bacterium]|nr:HAMP domain-containing sensor histidine kinase [Bacteroidota bacterium]
MRSVLFFYTTWFRKKIITTTDLTSDIDNQIELKPTIQLSDKSNLNFSDTMIYDRLEEEVLPYRVLKAIVSDGNSNFELTIRKSSIESDDLIESIIYPVLFLFLLLLTGFFIINWYVSKKLWRPFYQTLEQLERYKLNENSNSFSNTPITEFSELNKTLNTMIDKIQSDFISQKQFIENASHEIQTPLAIIKAKIELLIQSKNLNESDMQLIQSIYNASNKLSSLNKALLLLSKIENNQFTNSETIEIEPLIEKTLGHFEDMVLLKNISIEKKYLSPVSLSMDPVLADILISNLIQNAIRHNITNGSIIIKLSDNCISISNTSKSSVSNTDELFQRFKKNEGSAESIGLGLAIIKEICENYKIRLNYSCSNSIHTLQLNC